MCVILYMYLWECEIICVTDNLVFPASQIKITSKYLKFFQLFSLALHLAGNFEFEFGLLWEISR